jgi:hypothetical protein
VFKKMERQEAWWCKTKTTPEVDGHSTGDALLPPADEATDQRCISKLLGVTMLHLWEVLAKCKLAKKKGQFCMIDNQAIEDSFLEDQQRC